MIRNLLATLSPRYVFRDAGTGRFVSRWYAMLHPLTTIRQRVA